MKKSYQITIKPLTGIHIGTGNKLESLDYLVMKINGKLRFVVYSQESIMQRIADDPKKREKFDRASEDVSLYQLSEFFRENFQITKDLLYICDVTNSFLQEYESKYTKNPLDSTCDVLQLYRPEGKKFPVLTGSSFKGAIRTAMLNQIMHDWDDNVPYSKEIKEAQERKFYRDAAKIEREIQKKAFGNDAKNDFFRACAFGDTSFSARETQVVGKIENIAKQDYYDSLVIKGIPIYAELLKGMLMGSNENGVCHASIDVDLKKTYFKDNSYLSMASIAKACNYFFKREFKREYEKFYEDVDDKRLTDYRKLYEMISKIDERDKDSFLIRIGRWSQVEFVTCEPLYRMPKVPGNHGYGNTRMVFDNDGQLLPLGWCLCSIQEV